MDIEKTGTEVSMQRMQYLHSMRLQFSPPGMLNEDGSIRQEFFKPTRVIVVQPQDERRVEREASCPADLSE